MKKLIALFAIFLAPSVYAAETALTVLDVQDDSANDVGFENADTSNGNKVANPNGDVFLVLRDNSGGQSSPTVTIKSQRTTVDVPGVGTVALNDLTLTLSDGGNDVVVGPFVSSRWNDTNGRIILSYSATSGDDVDVSAMRLDD